MGKLLSFEQHRRSRSPRPATVGQGQLLIFTGVRYERTPQRQSSGDTPGKPTRRRG